jgi:hypothetical protein
MGAERVIERESRDGAEDVGAQRVVLEFPLWIVFPAEFYERGQPVVTRLQLCWGERKQFSPMRTRMKRRLLRRGLTRGGVSLHESDFNRSRHARGA